MNVQLLIDSVVRQTTVLIAQLATSGGLRAPLAHVANDVFLNLARELSAQGVSRSVSADMFGLALRSYRRRIHRLTESATDKNRSLWEAVLDFLSQGGVKTRGEVLQRFRHDDDAVLKSVLHDLCDSGLVFRLGTGHAMGYRAATSDELEQLGHDEQGFREWLWLLIYREGPLSRAELVERMQRDVAKVDQALRTLVDQGHASVDEAGYSSSAMIFSQSDAAGWEAAMFDHFQAVVRTICQRLRSETGKVEEVGGSTYTYRIWPGHPFEERVRAILSEFRRRHGDLRQEVQAYNSSVHVPTHHQKVIVYGGQCVVDHDDENGERDEYET